MPSDNLLEISPEARARQILDETEKLALSCSTPTTNILALLTQDELPKVAQDVNLSPGTNMLTPVLVVAYAKVPASRTPLGHVIHHRFLIIPGREGLWHLTRIVPSADAVGQVEAIGLAHLSHSALTTIFAVAYLGDQLTRSYMAETAMT